MTIGAASGPPLEDAPAEDLVLSGMFRLRAYLVCLALSLLFYLLAWGSVLGFAPLFLALAVLCLIAFACIRPRFAAAHWLVLPAAPIAAALLAVVFPLAEMAAEGGGLPRTVSASLVWPQIMVCVFAGRALAEHAELRFVGFWHDPLGTARPMAPQSIAAAFIFGLGLTLLFYRLVGGIEIDPVRLDPLTVTLRALVGETAVHSMIILLFFVVLAALFDAAALATGESAALAAFRDLCRERTADGRSAARAEFAAAARERLAPFSHMRVAQTLLEATEGAPSPSPARRSLDEFHASSRRLVRALLSFLPLLGFLGTVIGLTAAIGGLPAELDLEATGSFDISASLVGLALKFETTLLGLAGALIASLLLSLLERRESDLEAQCRRFADNAADVRQP